MSITNDEQKLVNFRHIKRHAIAGIADGEPALYATGIGYLPWRSSEGTIILVKCYYSLNAAETVISPNDIVLNHITDYSGWTQHSNMDKGSGYIAFHHRNTNSTTKFHLTAHNGLWYNHVLGFTDVPVCRLMEEQHENQTDTIRRMSSLAEFALLHDRTGHGCDDITESLHKHLTDCPKVKRHPFFKCPACMSNKAKHRSFNQVSGQPEPKARAQQTANVESESPGPPNQPDEGQTDPYDAILPEDHDLQPGQMFQMDFGFVRGSGFSKTDEDGRRVTSLDGMNSYLLIIDRKTRRLWVFLTKSKTPPLKIVKEFLELNGSRTATRRIVRTDQGGELWKSNAFQQMIMEQKFILEPTGAGTPQQNGLSERPNQTLGNMMRCLLSTANLPPEYWSWALIHAVYLKNRLPHRAIGCTPYFAWTGKKPSAKLLRIFGCPVVVKNPGRRPAKLDHHTSTGIFLGYTATDHNIYYKDSKTQRVKIATHVQFDEAGTTIPRSELSPTIIALQEMGMPKGDNITTNHPETQPHQHVSDPAVEVTKVKLLSDKGKLPQRATDGSSGYDIYSACDTTIPPGESRLVPTDITFSPPTGTYGQLLSRSGLSVKSGINVTAGTIDPDFRGNVMVHLQNSSDSVFNITTGDRIAQMVFYYIAQPEMIAVDEIPTTDRNGKGFGSTGVSNPIARHMAEDTPPNILDKKEGKSAEDISGICQNIIDTDGIKPYSIWLSDDPYDNRLTTTVDVRGNHPTLGLITQHCSHRNTIQLKDIEKSTPAARIHNWRSTLRFAYILEVQGTKVNSLNDLEAIIDKARQDKLFKIKITFGTERKYGVNPMDGNLQLYFDQMNAFAKHIYDSEKEYRDKLRDFGQDNERKTPQEPTVRSTNEEKPIHTVPDPDMGKSFTKKQLLTRDDWQEWRESQWKQLDQYHNQGMFSEPQKLPLGTPASFMHWTYIYKMCGTKKARMVCDGARNRSANSIGHTYANSLDAPSERLFWALVAKMGLIAVGADVSNAFAEAPPPAAPLYMYIDDNYRDWWEHRMKRPPIPKEFNVVRVNRAIQGHPESPRLWEKHIDRILRDMGLTPARHEPCLYSGTVNGERVFFLRQVDDFSVAAPSTSTCDAIIKYINAKMTMDVKGLGVVGRFNGMDIEQTKWYIKIHSGRYIEKMLENHGWTHAGPKPIMPIPLPSENDFVKQLETAIPPMNATEQEQLKKEMGFNYRKVIGECLWPMVKCRPDISPHIIKLSQFVDNPARQHYKAARQLMDYLAATPTEGIYYWRDFPVHSLPEGEIPKLHPDNHNIATKANNSTNLVGLVDSDWAGDTIKRKSISGIVIMYAGGAIAYKSKYQEVIAMSTTEAEFVAACDAAKIILFFRSIFQDLGIPQEDATILYEDNSGALLMANAQQPTKRTRHMDIKHFSLLDWVERDLLLLKEISTSDNAADAMTKMLPKQLFYRHFDTYMGRRIPDYVQLNSNSDTKQPSPSSCSATQNK